jgi:chromosome partitioning protein
MLVQANNSATRSTYVIVVGNEKGGSGKSTLAIHVAIALMKAGQRVATIDLDSRQQSFTHYVENRRAWSTRHKLDLEIPSRAAKASATTRTSGPSSTASSSGSRRSRTSTISW